MNTTLFDTLPLVAITPSLTNPRKTFDPVKLSELAESIRASGVHQPILVRPLPGSRVADTDRGVTHEIISGERRWRASELTALPPNAVTPVTHANRPAVAYRGVNGETWSGRGKEPRWVTAWRNSGGNMADILVDVVPA